MKRLLTSLLLLGLGCAPAPLVQSGEQGLQGPPAPPDGGPTDPVLAAAPEKHASDREDPAGSYESSAPRLPYGSLLRRSPPTAVDLGGTIDSMGGISLTFAGTRIRAHALPVPGNPRLYEITLSNTGSGWQEAFLLQVPPVPPTTPAPLLVVFHRFGVSHWDVFYNTTFLDEAQSRGWYLVAPLGATGVSFSSLESQINTSVVLNLVTSIYNIDRTRVYGVGFSMGGGSVTSYAARHIDPAGVMFAAIANHTGGVSLAHTYANEPDDNDADDNIPNFGDNLEVPDILDYWYGGPPASQAFAYQRCSVVDIDPATGLVGMGTDMSRNLAHVPVLDWVAASDPLVYLHDQTLILDAHIQSQNVGNSLTVVPANIHSWSTLDDTQVCNWLSQFTLQVPSSGTTLADQDATYFRFQVQQSVAGAFTPFSWTLDPVLNRFSLWATSNLKRVSIDAASAGLAYAGQVKLNLATSDGSGDQVLLLNLPYAPLLVTRDGVPASGTYDPAAHSFLVDETSGSGHQWVLTF